MKGILLAGGLGNRMMPLTETDNKHLLPVWNKRMVELPIKTLIDAGIDEIVLITGGKKPGTFLELLKNGKSHNIKRLYYTYQEGSGGIADALKLAQSFITYPEDCIVILGDNYFEAGISEALEQWRTHDKYPYANYALALLQPTDKPWDFGIATLNKKKNIIKIVEKPNNSKTDLAVLGCYIFDPSVWEKLNQVKVSERGELEITDVLNLYIEPGNILLSHNYAGYWNDMGSFQNWSEVFNRLKDQSCQS